MLILPHSDMGKRLYDPENAPLWHPMGTAGALLIVVSLGLVFDHLASEVGSQTSMIAGRTADVTAGGK